MQTLSEHPKVVFDIGAEANVGDLLDEVGAQRVMLVAQAHHVAGIERLQTQLGKRAVGVFTSDQPQVPGEVADAAVAEAKRLKADWVLAHGGGTAIGIAKAVALECDVKVAAVPTTYAGSERTDVWGITRDGNKKTGRDERVRPALVVYDPRLTVALNRELSLDSLFNALAHSLEALYADEVTPEAYQAAKDSLKPLIEGARAVAADPEDLAGRTLAFKGAALASAALGGSSMSLHHKLAHVLGGTWGTPHARTHALLLPYTFGFNAGAAPKARDIAGQAWHTDDPAGFLYDLQRELGLKTSLRDLDFDEEKIERVADALMQSQYTNPRPLVKQELFLLLMDALHDRRPSRLARRVPMPGGVKAPHNGLPVSVRGAPLSKARVVVLALHGRGASGDRFIADLQRRMGPRTDVALVAPQARDNTWYPKGFLAAVEDNQPKFDSALSVVEGLWQWLATQIDPARILPVGFSQGACLLLTWLSQTEARPARALAFTGALTPLPEADFAAAQGLALHMGSAVADPWIPLEVFEDSLARFRDAGAVVNTALTAGDIHGIHAADEAALRDALDRVAAQDELDYQSGFGNTFETEALPRALPRDQNSPRQAPYRLVPEQINGTGFTVRREENLRTWLYRLRPQVLPTGCRSREHGRFVGDFSAGVPLPEVLAYNPLALPEAKTDFLAGLTTFAGVGDAGSLKGAAIHLYAANADMDKTAFSNIDGDLLLVPEKGRLHLRTEMGRLNVAPGEIAVVPRGIRFQVLLPDGVGRGYVSELFDGHYQLPERGPIGANGLADERHFLAPVADFEDDATPWTIVVRQGGQLFEFDSPHTPFDVVAWHGTYTPYKYDLAHFNSLGSVSFDHPDPSILTVLTSPLDTRGRNAIDFAVFRSRWDVSEQTFRPPYFHRNSAVEFNGVLNVPDGGRFQPGGFLFTPYLTPHGIAAASYESVVTASDEKADQPVKMPEDSLWIQFESAYLMKVMPWMLDHESRKRDHLNAFSGYAPPADLP